MKSRLLSILTGAILFAAGLGWAVSYFTAGPDIPIAKATDRSFQRQEQPAAGLCPWREPEADRRLFFPNSTGFQEETLVLSGLRAEVERRLGRTHNGEENALRIHRILRRETPVGAVITRRARGESGVIEFVLALEQDGTIVGAKIQRLREPDAIAKALRSPEWLGAFHGKTGADSWQTGKDVPAVSAEARISAEALLSEARTALILFEVANRSPGAKAHH
jgi:hypothetical protein